MKKLSIKSAYYLSGAAMTVGAMGLSTPAKANGFGGNGVTNFSDITGNITNSISDMPGLLSSVSYLTGLLLMVLGVMKIKDHVEEPNKTPIQHGAIRLASGGALLALPILSQAALGTINGDNADGPAGPGTVRRIILNETFAN